MKVFILIVVSLVLGTIVGSVTNPIGGLITTIAIIAIGISLSDGDSIGKPKPDAM
jgi:type IV secretory pathway VirB2 component (pilin)